MEYYNHIECAMAVMQAELYVKPRYSHWTDYFVRTGQPDLF